MTHGRAVRLSALVAVALLTFSSIDLLGTPAPAADAPLHHNRQGFRNLNPSYTYSLAHRARVAFNRAPAVPRGAPLSVVSNDGSAMRANRGEATITWVGHSTFLVQMEGLNILTDPHWSERASPVGFAGPRRLVPVGLPFEDLPPIHVVLISHDHYDHLDAATVKRLAREHRPLFVVPLGVRGWLAKNGVAEAIELDWWESTTFRHLTITCTPAQHSSGRSVTFSDQNLRLWSSWAVTGTTKRFFFAGDTGYYPGLQEIGRRLGPFDLAAIPIGGYSDYRVHHPNHVNPEEAVQLLEDVRARSMVPMHWGTFDMNREPFREPPDRLLKEAQRRGLAERVAFLNPGETRAW